MVLLSLPYREILKKSKFTDHERNITKNPALEQLQRQSM